MNNITPIQEAINFWTDRYREAKEAGATLTKDAADLFLQYLQANLPEERKFIAGLAGSHSIGEEILKKLEEANPYIHYGAMYHGYLKCVKNLRSLINQQSLNNKEV